MKGSKDKGRVATPRSGSPLALVFTTPTTTVYGFCILLVSLFSARGVCLIRSGVASFSKE